MLALLGATPANAGEASITQRGGFTTLEYLAVLGETNTVEITFAEGSYTVTDTTAPVTVASVPDGCVISSLDTASCTAAAGQPIQRIWVNAKDMDDTVVVNASVPSNIFGRAGSDNLTGGAGPDAIEGDLAGVDDPAGDIVNVRGAGPDNVKCDDNDVVAIDADDVVTGPCTRDPAPLTTVGSGPDGPTNETLPTFSFLADSGAEQGYECLINPVDEGPFPCDSPFTETSELAEGPYTLFVRGIDNFGPGPWATRSFSVDTTSPQVNVVGPLVSTTATPSYEISSNEELESTECALGQDEFAPCGSTYTTPALTNGSIVLFVRGTDKAGNQTTVEVRFTVQIAPPGSGTPAAPLQPRRIIIESLVLISGRAVKMSRNGVVSIGLQCAGTKKCKGRMTITTADPVKRRGRKVERLGSARFSIAANKRKNVKVRFTKSKRKLAKRLKRFKAKVVITEVDQRGNQRISSRVFTLRTR